MEAQKKEIVIYIYHINKDDSFTEAGPAPAGQKGKILSSSFLVRAASHYAAQYGPAGFAMPAENSPSPFCRTQKSSRGKPFFPDCPWLRFSITHSGEYWACAMSAAEVGLDLQLHTKGRKERISARFFHPLENEYLRRCGYRDFFDIWAAKESYVKYTGRGIDENFASFTAAAPGALAPEINGAPIKTIPFRPNYSLCLCAPCIENVTIHYEAM